MLLKHPGIGRISAFKEERTWTVALESARSAENDVKYLIAWFAARFDPAKPVHEEQ
jgi:hypothetical protein